MAEEKKERRPLSIFEKAPDYRFNGSKIQVLDRRKNDGSVLYAIEIYGQESQMNETN